LRFERATATNQFGETLLHRIQIAERVENGKLPGGMEQRLVVVRAVDIHEPFAKRGEDIQGGGRTVDELAVHAVRSESALQQELLVLTRFKPVFVDKLLEWRAELGNIKNLLDGTTVAAAADQRAVSAFAE